MHGSLITVIKEPWVNDRKVNFYRDFESGCSESIQIRPIRLEKTDLGSNFLSIWIRIRQPTEHWNAQYMILQSERYKYQTAMQTKVIDVKYNQFMYEFRNQSFTVCLKSLAHYI